MIIVRHSEDCAGKPNAAGNLTGTCNCKTARLDQAAKEQLHILLGKLAADSLSAGEDSEYFALRLDMLVNRIRCTAKNMDRG